jgi:hypothetical protein
MSSSHVIEIDVSGSDGTDGSQHSHSSYAGTFGMIHMNQANTEQHRQGTLAPAVVLRRILARENQGKTSTPSLATTVEAFV